MSNYLSLARKWRPQQFTDVVGQSNITKTLSQAILKNRVHCGYIFTGSRGIGKTSIARIFAKNLRCENTQLIDHVLQSCDSCFNCKEIALSTSVDVIEIDGASNNGVDAVREIREAARFLPSSGTRKIYIIDEVHMLTTQAFNALLKTLEEPPPHIVFIFATTEPHKIPATILSRCQNFDFKRPTNHQIKTRLETVLIQEKITFEEGALHLISRAAEGSLRDSLSILDQVIAYAGEHITAQSVLESIGLIQGELILNVIQAIFKRTPSDAIRIVENAHNEGHDLKVFTKALLEQLHYIALIKVGCDPLLLQGLTESEHTRLKELTQERSLEEIELIFQVFHYGLDTLSRTPFPKILLDFLIIKTSLAKGFISVDTPRLQPPLKNKTSSPPITSKKNLAEKNTTSNTPNPLSEKHSPPSLQERLSQPENLIPFIAQKRPLLASLLEHAYHFQVCPLSTEKTQIKVFFLPEDAYKKEQLSTPLYMKQLVEFAEQYFLTSLELILEIQDEEGRLSFAATKNKTGQAYEERIKIQIENNPIIKEAQSLFGAKIGAVKITSSPSPEHTFRNVKEL